MTEFMKNAERKINKKKAAALWGMAALFVIALCLTCFFLFGAKTPLHASCEAHFIDVGQGDCTLLITENAAVVVDAGPGDAWKDTVRYIQSYTNTIDYLILTHPHGDHIGGAAQIVSRLQVKNVIMTDAESDITAYTQLQEELSKRKVNVISAVPGSIYTLGELQITLLAPLAPLASPEELNEYSIVTLARYGEASVLLTGDAENDEEAQMLSEYGSALQADILKLGHHGSRTSSGRQFLAAVAPRYAIASCGKDNEFEHPHQETMERAAALDIPVLRTDEMGSIVFATDGEEWTLIEN